jgi:plastocyanin
MKRLLRISTLVAALVVSASQVLAFFHSPEWREGMVNLEATEYGFEPDRVSIDPDEVAFVIGNKGRRRHGFALDGVAEKLSEILPGETAKITLTLPEGNYTIYCPIKGHRERGMVSTLGVGAVAEKPKPKPESAQPGDY